MSMEAHVAFCDMLMSTLRCLVSVAVQLFVRWRLFYKSIWVFFFSPLRAPFRLSTIKLLPLCWLFNGAGLA